MAARDIHETDQFPLPVPAQGVARARGARGLGSRRVAIEPLATARVPPLRASISDATMIGTGLCERGKREWFSPPQPTKNELAQEDPNTGSARLRTDCHRTAL
jgi:hypothetical protein